MAEENKCMPFEFTVNDVDRTCYLCTGTTDEGGEQEFVIQGLTLPMNSDRIFGGLDIWSADTSRVSSFV